MKPVSTFHEYLLARFTIWTRPRNSVGVLAVPVDPNGDHRQPLFPGTVGEVGTDGLGGDRVSESGTVTDAALQASFDGLIRKALQLFQLLYGARARLVVVGARVSGSDRSVEHAHHGYDGDGEDYYRHHHLYERVTRGALSRRYHRSLSSRSGR